MVKVFLTNMVKAAHDPLPMTRYVRRLPLPLDLLGAIMLVVGVAWLALWWRGGPAGPDEEVSGLARVVDGDSLAVDGTEVRLYGIDAPELHQTCERAGRPWPCGEAAKRRMAELAAGRLVRCRVRDVDRYRRLVAECSAGGEDLARRLVKDGLAVAETAGFAEEAEARAARRGLWAGSFVRPAEWRRANHRH
jgi:endonuclease YncB( thermonuclease family)